MFLVRLFTLLIALSLPGIAAAQFKVAFGGLKQDTTQPVEVTADTLSLNQTEGTALFEGNVLITQGEMRIAAPQVLVFYNEETSGISRMEASGRVLLVKGGDAAESDKADYDIETGIVIMTGDVLLTQGPNTLSSNKMNVNLETGNAELEGRVKTILKSEEK